LACFGLFWFGLVWFGLVWFCLGLDVWVTGSKNVVPKYLATLPKGHLLIKGDFTTGLFFIEPIVS